MRYLVLMLTLTMLWPVTAQEVYKTVDENGNVIYTDQPPEDDASPMDLPEISVVKMERPPPLPVSTVKAGEGATARNPYGAIQIVEPTADQSFWGSGSTLVVRLQAGQPLDDGHQVSYYMDGVKAGSSPSMSQLFTDIDRGEHQVRAEIINENGAVLASSQSVTFFMKQQSQLNPTNPNNSNKAKQNNKPARQNNNTRSGGQGN